MPYCTACDKYRTPTSLNADGTCPTCGAPIESPETCPHCGADQTAEPTDGTVIWEADWDDLSTPTPCWKCGQPLPEPDDPPAGRTAASSSRADTEIPEHTDDTDDTDDTVPWHFKLMVAALVVYLGWRFVELGADLFG